MSQTLLKVVSFAAFPAVAIIIGSLVAAVRAPGPRLRSAVQHLAAGTLFAALAAELLPDLVHRRLPWVTLIGFSLGVLCMLAIKQMSGRLDNGGELAGASKFPTSLLVTAGVDILLDGLLIGISFAASSRQGILVTVALTLEVLFLGVAVAAAAGGAYFLADANPVAIDAVMAFAVAALLYLVTEELLTEAHEVKETATLTLMFFAGFIVLLVIEMLV